MKRAKKNPQTAAQLYEEFHGKPADGVKDTKLPASQFNHHERLTQLGEAVSVYIGEGVELEVHPRRGVTGSEHLDDDEPGWVAKLDFSSDNPPQLSSNPAGTQLFFVGGNQDIGSQLMRMAEDGIIDPSPEIIDCGFCLVVEYYTQKGFDDFRNFTYFHALGEETGGFPGDNGANPRLIYNRIKKTLELAGGTYTVKPDGIRD